MPANANERPLLFVKEAADRLRVSPTTIRRAIHAGDLQAVRVGERGRYRVRPAALDELLRPAHPDTGEAA